MAARALPAGETCPALTLDPFEAAFLADPYAYHPALREAGPVVWLPRIGAFGMARYAEVKAALADPATFCSGRGVGLSDFAREAPWRPPSLLLESDPPLHDRTRGLMNRIVSPAALKALRPRWAAEAEALVEDLVARRRFDGVADLAAAYPMRVFPDAVGIPLAGRDKLLPYAEAVFNAFGPRNAIFAAGEARAAGAAEWVAAACERASLAPGSWGAMIHEAADRGECTPGEATRLVRSLLSAGVDTTVNGLAHLLLAFASFPAEWDRLRADPSLARRAFDESLRWDGTVQIFFRTTTRPADVGGTRIPADSKVLLFLAAANRDPQQWADPDRFDLGRVTSGHVGFGFGIHQCLGQMVARAEAEHVLSALIPRVKAIRLTAAPVRRLNNTVHALESLPLEFEPA